MKRRMLVFGWTIIIAGLAGMGYLLGKSVEAEFRGLIFGVVVGGWGLLMIFYKK
jgi:uncharacterized membrane protein HdeD (DUF308 family)